MKVVQDLQLKPSLFKDLKQIKRDNPILKIESKYYKYVSCTKMDLQISCNSIQNTNTVGQGIWQDDFKFFTIKEKDPNSDDIHEE